MDSRKVSAVMLLCAQSNPDFVFMAVKYPGRVGFLFGPTYYKRNVLRSWMPYALDNACFIQHDDWDAARWVEMLDWVRLQKHKPMWALVPDVVGNKRGTLDRWKQYAPIAARYGWPLAFAVQD